MSLNHLKIPVAQGNRPSALQHNGLVKALLRSRMLGVIPRFGAPTPYPHCWRVTADRFEATKTSKLDPKTTWRLDVTAGTVNDGLAAIPYLRDQDPRGWVQPPDYTAASTSSSNLTAWIDRDSLDDLDNPPFLVIRDPSVNATSSNEWTYIPDNLRPHLEGGAFCGADDWKLELWRAHVLLSAVPLKTYWLAGALTPPALKRYRLYTAGVKPGISFAAQSGGWLEIATLYLLRDPKAKDPIATGEIRVRQRVFWPLWVTIVQPGGALLDATQTSLQGIDYLTGLFTAPSEAGLISTLQSSASVEWWT